MISKNLAYLGQLLNLELDQELGQIKFSGVSTDSRTLEPGQLFIPLVGENFNGHKFIDSAFEKGAAACLSMEDRQADGPLLRVKDSLEALQKLARAYIEEIDPIVVAITGSNGKTSSKDILYSIASREYKSHKTQGNFNNYIGLPLTILEMQEDVELAILEMGIDHFGEMDLLSSIARPNIGLITNAGEAHLDDLGNSRNVAKAKMEFLKNMKKDPAYFYFKDDENLDSLAQDIKDCQVFSFGSSKESNYQFKINRLTEDGSYFYLDRVSPDSFFVNLIGKHNVYNSAAAIAIADYLKISPDNIRAGLAEVEASGMRNEIKKLKDYTILDDSYKSNPSSLKASLETLYSLEGYSRKIAIIGDMLGIGDDIEFMHRDIGKNLDPEQLDYVIGIGYYSEYIIWEAAPNFSKDRLFHFEEKPQDIGDFLESLLIKDSIVLIKASRPLELDSIVKELVNNNRK